MLSLLIANVLLAAASALSPDTRHVYHGPHRHPQFQSVRFGHAVIASLVWVIFVPLGAILRCLLPPKYAIRIHMVIQVFSYVAFIAATGMGIWMGHITMQLNEKHCVIGLLLLALAFIQCVGGYVHHLIYKRHQRNILIAPIHVWLGRVLITLAMINGGLGLLLSDDSTQGEQISYGVIAGLMWLSTVGVSAWAEKWRRENKWDAVEKVTNIEK